MATHAKTSMKKGAATKAPVRTAKALARTAKTAARTNATRSNNKSLAKKQSAGAGTGKQAPRTAANTKTGAGGRQSHRR